MKHEDIRHKLSEYLDGSVTAREKAGIEGHLRSCPECSHALKELRKTVEHIKTIEEVASPAWMTQKIMVRVREEAEEKRGIFRKLFFPLHIKLPLEAVAVLFLAVTTYYISQEMRPEMKLAQAPPEKVMAAPSSVTAGKGAPSVIAKDEALKQSRKSKTRALTRKHEIAPHAAVERKPAFAPLPSKPAGEPMPETASGAKADKFAAPAAPSSVEERAAKEPESFAPAKKREAAPTAGFVAMDEARREAPAPMAKALALVEKKETEITFTIGVKDLENAGKEIEKAVTQLNGKIIKTDFAENKRVFVARLNAGKLGELYDRLKRIGNLRSKETKLPQADGEMEIRIESVRIEY